MKVIYIAGCYRASTEYEVDENIQHAKRAMAKLLREGWVVICAHTMTAHLGGIISDDDLVDRCLELVRRSDTIYLLKGWEDSVGSNAEFKLAQDLGLSILYE